MEDWLIGWVVVCRGPQQPGHINRHLLGDRWSLDLRVPQSRIGVLATQVGRLVCCAECVLRGFSGAESGDRTDVVGDNHMRARADRDHWRARQRYRRAGKCDLVDRLLIAEQAYADMEDRWLRTADDLLVWIIVVDRLLAGNISPKP